MLARSGNFKFDDESDEDNFDEDYETEEDNITIDIYRFLFKLKNYP